MHIHFIFYSSVQIIWSSIDTYTLNSLNYPHEHMKGKKASFIIADMMLTWDALKETLIYCQWSNMHKDPKIMDINTHSFGSMEAEWIKISRRKIHESGFYEQYLETYYDHFHKIWSFHHIISATRMYLKCAIFVIFIGW